MIEVLEEKKNFLKVQKKNGKTLIKVKCKQTEDVLYLGIENLRGNKYFYFIPYSKHISNDWEQLAFSSKVKMETIYRHYDFFNVSVDELEKRCAVKWCERYK